ncbi:MAG: HK97 family phage prohead protease [Flavobacteriales bacterium]
MPRFILNDETKRNSYGFKIFTSGIDLMRFKTNPVMLDGHVQKNQSVIGSWKDPKVENGVLSADTDFDTDDENAKSISEKVDRGHIRGASMGVSFSKENLKMIDGELTLEKCELLEASIVAIPSNSNALRLYCDGEILSDTDMKTLCLSVAQDSNKNGKNEKSNLLEMKKIQLSQLAVIALGMAETTGELDVEQVNSLILSLSKDRDKIKNEKAALQAKLDVIEQAEKDKQVQLSATLIDNAIKSGQISAAQKQTFVDLALSNYALAKETIESLPKKRNFSAGVSTASGTSGVATMEDFQKLSTAEQIQFKQDSPEAFQAIVGSI